MTVIMRMSAMYSPARRQKARNAQDLPLPRRSVFTSSGPSWSSLDQPRISARRTEGTAERCPGARMVVLVLDARCAKQQRFKTEERGQVGRRIETRVCRALPVMGSSCLDISASGIGFGPMIRVCSDQPSASASICRYQNEPDRRPNREPGLGFITSRHSVYKFRTTQAPAPAPAATLATQSPRRRRPALPERVHFH